MKIATGSDQALIFFNHIVNRLLSSTYMVKKKFSAGITPEEKICIINALQEHIHVFDEDKPWKEAVKMVRRIDYDSQNNSITVLVNLVFIQKLKKNTLQNWPYQIIKKVG